jgi:universal stress protein E
MRKILVAVADPSARSNKAVKRAGELAHGTGASLELFHSIPSLGPFFGIGHAEGAKLLRVAAAHNAALLERMAKPLRREELVVATMVLTGYAAHEAILRRARTIGADLIIIESHKHGELARLLLSQTDFELIRRSPIPVLIVKGHVRWRSPRILAAVDPFHAHEKPRDLDSRIVDTGRAIVDALHGSLHLAHVWWPLAEAFPAAIVEPTVLAVTPVQERSYQREVHRQFKRATSNYDVPPRNRHLRRGDPGIELPALARSLNASLVVMGAVSRSGLQRLFIGNTAERVLDNLRCDALIVKPAGFRPKGRR